MLDKPFDIPEINAAGMKNFRPIAIGSVNRCYRVETTAGNWFLRLNQMAPGINRALEARILHGVDKLGLCPTIIANRPEDGYLLTEWIDENTWHGTDIEDNLRPLKAQLKRLHKIKFKSHNHRWDQRLRRYAKTNNTSTQKTIEALIYELHQLKFWEENRHLCHFDLNPGNIMGNHPPKFVDWEFAGPGHPLLDWLILENENDLDLEAHYPEDINRAWIEPCRKLIEIMMKIWRQ